MSPSGNHREPKGIVDGKRMTVLLGIAVMVSCSAASSNAATPEAWADLMKRASETCTTASGLKKAKASKLVDFSDKVLVAVDGNWPQPHLKNAAARFACLYDKRSQTAEAMEWAR